MGNTYTRQSSFTDGDVITADLFNNEYDQLLAAFAASTGHTHDGTAGEGGPITKLLGTNITIGDATTGTDITVTFDGESNDGVFKWMEDEDYFEFSDDILVASTEKLQFRDTAIYINSSADGQLDLVADTEIQLAATTIDINGAVDISGNLSVGGNLDVTGTFDLSDANFTNAGDISLDSISGDADSNTSIAFSGSDVITITTGGETQITFNNGSILPTTDDDVDLGSSALQFKDLYIDGTANIDAASIDALTVSGSTTLAATSFGDADITNVGSIALDTITNDGTDITLDSGGDIILDAAGNEVFFKASGTSILTLKNDSSDAVFTVETADKNFTIKGTDGSSAITALDIDMALAGKATFNGDVVVGGDLTISGDDLTMATNTAGALLIADGTNFNPTLITSLSEISTAADDDVLLAIDTSGGGLKKISRSAIIAGTGSSGDLANVAEDSTPQLGGNLDLNGNDIVTTSNATLDLAPNGTGTVVVRGNTNSGAIVFNCESNSHGQKVYGQPHSAGVTNTLMLPAGANSTLVSLVSTDTLTNKTLTSPKINEDVAVTATATEINVLDGITAVVGELNALDIGSTAVGTAVASKAVILDSNKDFTGIRNFTISGNLSVGGTTTVVNTVTMEAANAVVFEGATADAHETTLTIVDPTADRTINLPNQSGTIPVLAAASNTAVTATPEELNILDGVTSTAAELNILDGVTSTAAELNILDGVTSTAAELNTLDGITAVVGELNALDLGATAVGTAIASKAMVLDSNKDYTGVRNFTLSGELDAGSLDISGDADIDGTLETDALSINGTAVTSTAAELNILDGVTATASELNLLDGGTSVGSSITVADADGFVVNDGGTMKTIPASDVKTYAAGSAATKGFAIAMAIVFG